LDLAATQTHRANVIDLSRISGKATVRRKPLDDSSRPVRDAGLPRSLSRSDTAYPLSAWDFTLRGADGKSVRWTWDEFVRSRVKTATKDIHCVTKWSKFRHGVEGISIDTILSEAASKGVTSSPYQWRGVMAVTPLTCRSRCDGWEGGRIHVRWQASSARSTVARRASRAPPLLLKSAKWVREIRLMESDMPGFWESLATKLW